MSGPLHDQLETALAELREQQQKIKQFGSDRSTQRTTVHSKNRMVTVTVDSDGRLTDVSFKGNRYRNLPPLELGSLIADTVRQAQAESARETWKRAAALMPGSLDMSTMFGIDGAPSGEFDVDAMIESAVRLADLPVFTADDEPGAPGERPGGGSAGV